MFEIQILAVEERKAAGRIVPFFELGIRFVVTVVIVIVIEPEEFLRFRSAVRLIMFFVVVVVEPRG